VLLVGAAAFSGFGGASDFPYCDVPLNLPESSLASEMALNQLQVVIRHGDRTPSAKIPVGTIPWVCEPFAHTLRFLDVSPQAVNQEIGGPFSYPPSCSSSQLTKKGRNQQLALGAAMRRKYVERLGFLPPALTPSNQGQILFRSTDSPRTRQSGQAFLVGLYPASE
jgi:acid phosphatase